MKPRGGERKVSALEEICRGGASEAHRDVTNTASISNQRNSGMFPADLPLDQNPDDNF